MDIEKVPEIIVDGTVDANLASIATDVAELGLDTLLDEGFLKDLPAIGLIIKSLHFTKNIKDRLFVAKVAKFLMALKDTSEKDKNLFRKRISKDLAFKKKVGETLLLILDRLDDLNKPEIVARVFQAFMANKISYSEFRRLASAIDIAFLDDLLALLEEKPSLMVKRGHRENIRENLFRAGLCSIAVDVNVDVDTRINKSNANADADVSYIITGLGKLFIKIMKEDWPQ